MARGVVLLLLFALACGLSCKSGSTAARPELVAPPESLFAEATLQDPDSFWKRLRNGAGGSLLLFPDTAAGLVFAKARLDPRLANLVMGGLPFHVALGEAGNGGLAFAIAMKVRDLHAAESAVGAWDAGARRSVAGMALLSPFTGLNAPETATALSPSGYLVVASSEADLATLGVYAATTLPSKPAPKSPFEIRAAAGALAQAGVKATNLGAWVTSGLLGLARRAFPPMFDSGAFVACVNPIFVAHAAMLADLQEAKLDVETGDGEIHAVATLTPKGGDNGARRRLASIQPADAAPLLDAPADASYAIWASDTPAERAEDAATIAPCFEHALGAFLGPDGTKTLDGVFTAWAKGRADWDRVALVSSANANGLVIAAPVADADSTSHALQGLTDIVAQPPVADAIQQIFSVRPGVVEHALVPPLGNATLVTFSSAPRPQEKSAPGGSRRPPPPPSPPIGLAWAERASEVDVGVGQAPRELLALAGDPGKLGSDRATALAVHALGGDASFAAVLRPFGCCRTGGPSSTPLTFGWGRHGDAGWSRIEMGYGLLVQLAAQTDSVRSAR
ncbi:MAG: hypothetical protein ACLQVI_34950 [Polyangiaceae bacterium]